MMRRRPPLLLLLAVAAATAACASGGSGYGAGSGAGAYPDCLTSYGSYGYPAAYGYYGNYGYGLDEPCSVYPQSYYSYTSYTPEYAMRRTQPHAAESRSRRTHTVHRPGTDTSIGSSFPGSYSGSGGSSAPGPTFAPEPRMAPAAPSAPAPSPTTIQPRSSSN